MEDALTPASGRKLPVAVLYLNNNRGSAVEPIADIKGETAEYGLNGSYRPKEDGSETPARSIILPQYVDELDYMDITDRVF